MKPCNCVFLVVSLSVPVASAFAQDVPRPPRPADAPQVPGRSGAATGIQATAKLLQDALNSIGRVNWSQTARNPQTGAATGPEQAFEEVSGATVNPSTCEMRVARKASGGRENVRTYFLEEVGEVRVVATEEHWNRLHPLGQYSMSPAPYSVEFEYNWTSDFKARDEQTANQIAGVLRQLARQCATIPPPAANSGPSLAVTLGFIEDKLNDQNPVNWLSTMQDTVAGTTGAPQRISDQIVNAAGDPHSCILTFHRKRLQNGNARDGYGVMSLRRVEKLAVMSHQDAAADMLTRGGHPELIESISPVIYDVAVTRPAGNVTYLQFADQELANRVAKAMLHAVELCGGGNKDPF